MIYTLEIPDDKIREAIKRVKDRGGFGFSPLEHVLMEAIKEIAKDKVLELFKENRELVDELEKAIINGINISLLEFGNKIGSLMVDGIREKLESEFNRYE